MYTSITISLKDLDNNRQGVQLEFRYGTEHTVVFTIDPLNFPMLRKYIDLAEFPKADLQQPISIFKRR